MPNYALIVLTGHVGKAEDLKYLPKGDAVLRFSLCVNTGYGEHKTASWYDCSLFGKRAEKLCLFITKGKPITVIGEPSIRKWESNGKAGTSVSVRVQDVVLLGSNERQVTQEEAAAVEDHPAVAAVVPSAESDESIPF